MAIRRELASARPDAFRPDLARSLSVQGDCLEATNHLDAAQSCDCEAVALLTPDFVRWPNAFAGLMQAICQDYVRRCEAAGVELDEALLAPVIESFQRLQGTGDNDAATEEA